MEPIQEPNQHANDGLGTLRPMLSFGEAVSICWKKYSDFKGRARRSEYWWWALLSLIAGTVAKFIDGTFNLLFSASSINIVSIIVWLVLIIPSLAVATRRLHDTGRSGWWIVALAVVGVIEVILSFIIADSVPSLLWYYVLWFVILILLLLSLILLYFEVLDSHKGENQYGPSPKYQ